VTTFDLIGDEIVVPTTPAGEIRLRLEHGIVFVARTVYGSNFLGDVQPDRTTTMRIPVEALEQLLR
jgi:hypothetical protein